MSDHFDFTKLVVGDLAGSAKFYEAVAQLQPQHRIEASIAGRPIAEIIYQPTAGGAGKFVLLAYLDRPQVATGELITGFLTRDVDAFMARVRTHGGRVVVQPYETETGETGGTASRIKVGFATDPEGHLMEVVQIL